MPIDQPPPAPITEQHAMDYDPTDIISVMQKLASLTPSTAKAREIMNTYPYEDGRQLWRAVWGLETAQRALDLRRKDPDAKIPEEWHPL